jgi:glycosyltransferase involved in cell wall biosynthesis
MTTPRFKVTLYSGIVVQHDAVSESLQRKLDILRGLIRRGAPIEVSVCTHATDDPSPEFSIAPSVARLVGTRSFWETDLHVFEFGMYYDLVDALFVIPPSATSLVIDHNTTPPELVDQPEVKAGCQLALVQRHNLRLATHVACVSEFSLELVRSVGVDQERQSVLHLPPTHEGSLLGRHFGEGGGARPVELLFVGRFVRAKGVRDLLALGDRLWADGTGRCRLRLVGSPTFADADIFAEVEAAVARSSGTLALSSRLDDDEMVAAFARADLLVIPSLHEGYCVPVIEAYTAGCHVVGYDAANLPNVIGGLGTLVPTGDVAALGDAVDRFIERAVAAGRNASSIRVPTERGDLSEVDWLEAVRAHLADYSASAFEVKFLALLRQLAEQTAIGLSPELDDALSARRAELAGAP